MLKPGPLKSALILLATLAAPTPIARTLAAQVTPTAQTLPAAKPITFEVISIRLNKPGTMAYGRGFTDDGLSLHGMTTSSLLYSFFGGARLEGLPDWAREGYDIQAKVSDEDVAAWKKLNFEQRNLAVQALMEDQFKLKWHRETREMPGYALIVMKNGPRFREATPGDTYTKGVKALDDSPLLGVMMETREGVVIGQRMSMPRLAAYLSMPAGRPVLDKTGLTGTYDLTLKFDRQPPLPAPAASSADGVAVATTCRR